jgi:glutathione synthase
VRATACRARSPEPRSLEAFLGELQSDRAMVERITIEDLDVLLLRNDPAADSEARPWAQMPAVLFGQIAA